jgi:hypothetical protein
MYTRHLVVALRLSLLASRDQLDVMLLRTLFLRIERWGGSGVVALDLNGGR